LDDLARELGVSATTAAVLIRRGHVEAAAAGKFFEPKLAHLTPPEAMKDRAEASERIARAVRAREKICVFGDYDADGITSAALLTDVLRTLGGDVRPLIADRFDGGYGLSQEALGRVFATGATLLITCDCGTSDHPRLHEAKQRGLDVVVIDHHKVPDEALPALAFLNPHRPECGFAYKGLASVGLALSICAALRASLDAKIDLRHWLDLVALGTIADVAPLDGDNRALVRVGLGVLAHGLRPGIRALAEVAKVTGASVTGEDIAFRFAPRINAPGRLAKGELALELLLAKDPAIARALAAEVDQICERRKLLDRTILAEALVELSDPGLAALPVIVLGREGWHQGVVGIVAGRLASRFGKPTIVIGFDGATGRGSARGPAGVQLYTMLDRAKEHLLGFGGHEAAAGVHLEASKLDAFRQAFAAAAREVPCREVPRYDEADAVFVAGDDPARVTTELARFEPCGQGNPAPRLSFPGVRVRAARVVGEEHLKLEFELPRAGDAAGPPRTLSAFGYRLGRVAPKVGDRVDVTGALRPDTWRGNGAVELRIHGLAAEGSAPVLSD
jgi:single-stranded-DNA-specific exonuclease